MYAEDIIEPAEDDPDCVGTRLGDVAVIWINDRKRRNPLSLGVRELLIPAMQAAQEDPELRAIVLAGAGGCFCAGGDIAGMTDMGVANARQRMHNIQRLVRLIREGPKPVIAAVEGFAIGAGLSLMSACDIVVSSREAKFSLPFGRIGLIPDLGVLQTMPERIGLGRTRLLALSGRMIDAQQAASWGLVEELAEQGEAAAQALTIAREIAVAAPLSTAVTKQLLARAPGHLDQFLGAESDAQAMLFQTDDFAEGARSFLEKRPPRFTGR